MRTRIFQVILYVLLFSSNLGAFETYSTDSPFVDDLNRLYHRAGMVFPTASYPVDKTELYRYASALRRSAESREIRAEIDDYLDRLAYDPEKREVVSEETAAFEQYLRGDAVYVGDIDYYRSYIEAAPFLAWALSAGSDGGTGIHVSAELVSQNDPEAYPENNLFQSAEGNPVSVENYFMTTGYFTHRTGDFLLQLGRTPVHFGSDDFSSILPSDRLPYLDAMYYTWSFGPLKMSSFFSSFYNSAGGSEIEEMNAAGLPNIDTVKPEDGIITYSGPPYDTHTVAFNSTMILAAMHRFEWAFDRLRIGMSALHLSSRENNAFHIGDIFPVFSWHNGQVGPHNMSLILETSLVPCRGLVLFAQAGYDDINSEDLTGVGDTAIPTIPAYVLGIEYSYLPGGKQVDYLLEGGYTHYLWGNFHEFDPDRGNYLARAIYRYLRDEETMLLPFTSPYGPGTMWVRADARVQFSGPWSIALNTETIFKNTRADLVTTAYEASDEVENGAMSLWGGYALKIVYAKNYGQNCRFSLYMEPALLVRDTDVWPEVSFGGRVDMIHRMVLEE